MVGARCLSAGRRLWQDFLDRLERCLNVCDMCRRGQSDCSPGIFVSKVESAQFANSLARFLHIDRDLSQGPWVGSRSCPCCALAHLCVGAGCLMHLSSSKALDAICYGRDHLGHAHQPHHVYGEDQQGQGF